MSIVANMKLTNKIVLPIALLAIGFVVITLLNFQTSRGVAQQYDGIITSDDVAAVKMARFSKSAMLVPYDIYRLTALSCTKGEAPACEAVLADYKASVAAAFKNIDDASRLDPDQAEHGPALAAFRSRFAALASEIQNAVDPAIKDETSGLAILKSVDPKFIQLHLDVSSYNDKAIAGNAAQAHTIAADAQWSSMIMLAIGLGIVLLGVGISLWMSISQVSRPLVGLGAMMRRLAGGDLDAEITGQARADEIGGMAQAVQVFKINGLKAREQEEAAEAARRQSETLRTGTEAERAVLAREQAHVVTSLAEGLNSLANGALGFRLSQPFATDYDKLRIDFNGAMEKLQDTMKIVATNSAAIRSGSGEISSAADDLSRRTEQQAASLEETAAALDEITATVRRTAEGSKHARDVVGQAKKSAEDSSAIVRHAVEAMSGIETSSSQIGNIIGVIDEIAFQTNLLALNAGVEAARAGDAGRGFAVVASEVRALAQRSADAAKEIKTLISASSAQVEKGVEFVGQTGQALAKIVANVAEINGIVGEIAASAQEQASGLDQVNIAVNQMDQVTQQNAAMVEETTAASHALVRETDELSRVIGGFDIGQTTTANRPAAKPLVRATAAPARAVQALKPQGRGGAVRKPESAAEPKCLAHK